MGTERLVRARGSVMADTWYEIDAVCPEEMEIKTDIGLARHCFSQVLGKRRINFYISSGKAIDECDKIINEYKSDINDPNTPEVVKKQLQEDLTELEKVLDQYLNNRDEFQKRIKNNIINNELKKLEDNDENKDKNESK